MHHSNCLHMLCMKVKLPLNKPSLPPTEELVCRLHKGGGGGRVIELLREQIQSLNLKRKTPGDTVCSAFVHLCLHAMRVRICKCVCLCVCDIVCYCHYSPQLLRQFLETVSSIQHRHDISLECHQICLQRNTQTTNFIITLTSSQHNYS